MQRFGGISDIKNKTQDELNELHSFGYNYISIGAETGNDVTLAYMNKRYAASDIVEQHLGWIKPELSIT